MISTIRCDIKRVKHLLTLQGKFCNETKIVLPKQDFVIMIKSKKNVLVRARFFSLYLNFKSPQMYFIY